MIDPNKRRILIVDDEAAICQFCQRVLIEEGFEADCAPDGKSAQSILSERQYDLYLFDIKMPQMDGKELYESLRKTDPNSAEKVLFMTGSAIGQDTESFFRSSGRSVLLKPFTIAELKTQIKEALEKIDT